MPFEPRICTCSYSEYRHVVKSDAEWQRPQAKALIDHVGAAFAGNNASKPITAGPQRTRKRSPSVSLGEEDSVEENTQPLIRRVKRELPDPYIARLPTLKPRLSKQMDPSSAGHQLEGTSNSGAEPTIQRDTEEELRVNVCQVTQDEGFLLPRCGLEDDDNTAEETDDTEDSDQEMFELMVGAMRRGYEVEETDEEETDGYGTDEEDEKANQEDDQLSHCEPSGALHVRAVDSEDQVFHADTLIFDYRDPFGDALTTKDVLSMSMYGIHREFKTQRRCVNKIHDVMGRMLDAENKPHDERTVNKRIKQRTGVNEIMYDCCPRSHMSYAMYLEDTECRVCQHPRWKTITNLRSKNKTEKRVPYARHIYIPLTH
ncbi:hypothetical protein FN846DRAFT_893949 [Sphaerosporella brunnea]|uniref:Uncharacterized protein n=1 Tax=Sphaerosporella brunnea TaxID=1250544 RepID=A0A5J5EIZ4_9PEZI|nr:hypothetical protein FN846DRAFT_893949 [Sphaerosporella brunnea]